MPECSALQSGEITNLYIRLRVNSGIMYSLQKIIKANIQKYQTECNTAASIHLQELQDASVLHQGPISIIKSYLKN